MFFFVPVNKISNIFNNTFLQTLRTYSAYANLRSFQEIHDKHFHGVNGNILKNSLSFAEKRYILSAILLFLTPDISLPALPADRFL